MQGRTWPTVAPATPTRLPHLSPPLPPTDAAPYARGMGIVPLLPAAATGLLLFASNAPLFLWPLQLVAWIPLFAAIRTRAAADQSTWPLALVLAASYLVPLLAVAGTTPPILTVMAVALLQLPVVVWVLRRQLAKTAVAGSLAAAAAMTLLEFAVWHGIPLFGTAQCFARPLSAAPHLVGFIAYTGLGGLVFVLVAVQALLTNALLGRERRRCTVWALAILLAAGALSAVRWHRPLERSLPTAVWGYGKGLPEGMPESTIWEVYQRAARTAVQSGAALLVTPETFLQLTPEGEDLPAAGRVTEAQLQAIAREHGIALAVGTFRWDEDCNSLYFYDSDGASRGEYRKTHLVPFFEDYQRGDGSAQAFQLGDVRIGGMICQDDNFTDIARAQGRLGTQLLTIPTNDWKDIRHFHLENSIFRAIEGGFAMARAASNGISALVSPRGEVLQHLDHTEVGTALLYADLPVGDGVPTLYAKTGDWPVALASLVVLAFYRRRQQNA